MEKMENQVEKMEKHGNTDHTMKPMETIQIVRLHDNDGVCTGIIVIMGMVWQYWDWHGFERRYHSH